MGAATTPSVSRGDGRPDRALYLPGVGVVVTDLAPDEVLHEFQRGLLPGHLAFELLARARRPLDAEDVLDAVGHVASGGYLDVLRRIAAAFASGLRDVEGVVQIRFQPLEVLFVGLSHL